MKFLPTALKVALSSLLITGSLSASASDIEVEETKKLSLSGSDLTQFKIDAAAGFLVIEGDEGLDSIEVTADIAAYNDKYQLSLVKKGSKAVLLADPNPESSINWFSNGSAKIDLTIKVPKGMSLDIDDGSGNIDINYIDAEVTIDDGSGNIDVQNIGGMVHIDDGSGNLNLSNISGKIKVDDGSGNIDIRDVKSDVDIEDGSGQIKLVGVGGEVDIDDGSGDLLVKNAKGHVTIDDGSGDIKVNGLSHGLTVISSGSGGLSMEHVEGKVVTK